MIQGHYIYCTLYFHYYYIMIHNAITIQLSIMENLWEPRACFPEARQSRLGVMEDGHTQSVLCSIKNLSSPVICPEVELWR